MKIYTNHEIDKEPLTAEEQTGGSNIINELEERESLENIAKYSETNSKDVSEALAA